MVRAVAVDVDGTLLDSHHQISRPTVAAVRAAGDRGVAVGALLLPLPG